MLPFLVLLEKHRACVVSCRRFSHCGSGPDWIALSLMVAQLINHVVEFVIEVNILHRGLAM